ncbi:MAG: hypothetical protein LUF26_06685 [Firmicutes bacterium]|nr:hypothetical protein [Bacillota bacterium]
MKRILISLICAVLILSVGAAAASSVSVTSEGFSASDAPEGSVLIAALYKGGVLDAVRIVSARDSVTQAFDEEFLAYAEDDDIIKVYLWDKETLSPVCGFSGGSVSELAEAQADEPQATEEPSATAAPQATDTPADEEDNTMTVTIGDEIFTAVLYDNETAQAFSELLPMTLNMTAFGGNNEYYYYFDSTFPTDSYRPGTVSAGDLKLYGNDCLVIFYETFSTSYSYTDIGYIENPDGLEDALAAASGTVTIEMNAD